MKRFNVTLKTALSAALLLTLTLAGAHSAKADDDDDMDMDKSMYDVIVPLPMSYPFATPGNINLYHYKDYTKTSLRAGSVQDYMDMKMAKLDAKMEQERMERDAKMTEEQKEAMMKRYPPEPYPMSYPFATPGNIDLYHFMDYRMVSMMAGSVSDMREMNMMEMDKEAMMHMKPMSDEMMAMMADPLNLDYPFATPGNINLYHYKDYTKTSLMSGSALDAREMMMMEMDKMTPPVPNNLHKDKMDKDMK